MRPVVLGAGARRARRSLLLVGLVFAALPVGSALADTTIGQVGGDLNHGCVALAVYGDTKYVVPPGGGAITSFSFLSVQEHNEGEQLVFLVLRPAGGSNYTVVGTSDLETLAGIGLETFPVSPHIPVQGGDILGFWSGNAGVQACSRPAMPQPGGSIKNTGQFVPSPPGVGHMLSLALMDTSVDLNESANLGPTLGTPPPPTSKKQCKHGGWKKFGSRFKNQGQCVRFVKHHHHKKHHHKRHHHKHHPSG
jgi:hypothetical protein